MRSAWAEYHGRYSTQVSTIEFFKTPKNQLFFKLLNLVSAEETNLINCNHVEIEKNWFGMGTGPRS